MGRVTDLKQIVANLVDLIAALEQKALQFGKCRAES